jgi:hypothetical protein
MVLLSASYAIGSAKYFDLIRIESLGNVGFYIKRDFMIYTVTPYCKNKMYDFTELVASMKEARNTY